MQQTPLEIEDIVVVKYIEWEMRKIMILVLVCHIMK